MVKVSQLGDLPSGPLHAYRLVNSKFPPIALFDDVADADEFEALYQIQALTNPRLGNEVGRIELIPRREIPFGIVGCSYAIAPFTHVNPAGSRFSAGDFGVLYLAATVETALAEVRYHQNQYWSGVHGLNYERFVFRGLSCTFAGDAMKDATSVPMSDPIYDPDDYSYAQRLGGRAKEGRLSRPSLPVGALRRRSLLGVADTQAGVVDCPGRPLRDGLEWTDHQCQQNQRSLRLAGQICPRTRIDSSICAIDVTPVRVMATRISLAKISSRFSTPRWPSAASA